MIVKSAAGLPRVAIVGLGLVGIIADPWHEILLASARCVIDNHRSLKLLDFFGLRQLNFQEGAHCRDQLEILGLLELWMLINR